VVTSTIERLLRRELRDLQPDPAKGLFLVRTGTVEHGVAAALLRDIFGGRAKVTAVGRKTRRRINVLLPSSVEHELVQELRAFLEDEEYKPRFPRIMATIPEEAILAYARKRGITGSPLARRDDVRGLLEELQRSQPQTKSALRKSFAMLRAAPRQRTKRC
jgi:hypothetical protein